MTTQLLRSCKYYLLGSAVVFWFGFLELALRANVRGCYEPVSCILYSFFIEGFGGK